MKFPLKLKSKIRLKTLNVADTNAAPITVHDMLAAAEGRTSETEDKLDPRIAQERAAAIGLWSAIIILLISAASLALPAIDVLIKLETATLLQQPMALLGLFQAGLSLILLLQVTQAYPLVRLSSTLGIGMVGFILWSQGLTAPMASFILGSLGLYFCTVFVSFIGIGISAGLGIAGIAGYAFFALST